MPILLEAVLKVLNDMLVIASSPEFEWQKNIQAYLKKQKRKAYVFLILLKIKE